MTADEFNENYPIGTPVHYYPVYDDARGCFTSRTRSEAWELGSGDVIVKIEGKAGGVSIDPGHLEPFNDDTLTS